MNYFGMALVNFFTYSIIPFFVARSGATLLNLSNVTTIIWSMLFDIVLYGNPFYPLCLLGFSIELVGIIVFSTKEPYKHKQEGNSLDVNEMSPLCQQEKTDEEVS